MCDALIFEPPRHLYLHIPFCVRACDYCAFYKEVGSTDDQRGTFLDGLAREAEKRLDPTSPLQSIYVGGGTPSFLKDAEWERLVTIIHDHARLADMAEFSIEVNPASLTKEKLGIWRDAGINRISLGLQTFDDGLRKTIGRAGSASRIMPTIEALRGAGFENISCDLIYAISGQTLEMLADDLRQLAELEPMHVSTYSLMLEHGTKLAGRMEKTVDDELSADMYELITDMLGEAGLSRYEVSNLARSGRECRHNDAVWHGEPFVGLGPSASWFAGGIRYTNPADLGRWLAGEQPEADVLPAEQRAVEILATGLRTIQGWTRSGFRRVTGFEYMDLRGETLEELAAEGLLALTAGTVRPTMRGLLLADFMARELY